MRFSLGCDFPIPPPQSDDEKDTFLIMSMLSVMNQMDTLFSCLVLVLDEGDAVVIYLFSSRWSFVWFRETCLVLIDASRLVMLHIAPEIYNYVLRGLRLILRKGWNLVM